MYSGRFSKLSECATIASAATITPTCEVAQISGVAAIATITVPPTGGFSTVFYVIPTGVFTWTAAGNIGLAGTAVVGKLIVFVYSKAAGKWYPSVIA